MFDNVHARTSCDGVQTGHRPFSVKIETLLLPVGVSDASERCYWITVYSLNSVSALSSSSCGGHRLHSHHQANIVAATMSQAMHSSVRSASSALKQQPACSSRALARHMGSALHRAPCRCRRSVLVQAEKPGKALVLLCCFGAQRVPLHVERCMVGLSPATAVLMMLQTSRATWSQCLPKRSRGEVLTALTWQTLAGTARVRSNAAPCLAAALLQQHHYQWQRQHWQQVQQRLAAKGVTLHAACL